MSAIPVLTTLTRNRIVVTGEEENQIEGVVGATAIKPGMWVRKGTDGLYVPHPTAGGDGPVLIAKENPYNGGTVDTSYAAGDRLFIHVAEPGDVLLLRVKTGESIAIGASGISDGAGSFKAVAGTPIKYPVIAEETITSASSNPLKLFRVQ
jgi:hypothetical protein